MDRLLIVDTKSKDLFGVFRLQPINIIKQHNLSFIIYPLLIETAGEPHVHALVVCLQVSRISGVKNDSLA